MFQKAFSLVNNEKYVHSSLLARCASQHQWNYFDLSTIWPKKSKTCMLPL